jgi:hypothetical protein
MIVRFALTSFIVLFCSLNTHSQNEREHLIYTSFGVALLGSKYFGNNHLSHDLENNFGYSLAFRIPIKQFGFSLQYQNTLHNIREEATFFVNSKSVNHRVLSMSAGIAFDAFRGVLEPRLSLGRSSTKYMPDYRNRNLVSAIGLKYGKNIGKKGLYLYFSTDFQKNITKQIKAPEAFSNYMNQQQSVLLNLGIEYRFIKN